MDYKTRQKIEDDISQCILNPDLTISKNISPLAKKQINIRYDEIVLCPFCLKSYELDRFKLSKGLRVCPNCTVQLKLSTLAQINDLDKFAKFVFNYRFSGFWDKICLDIPQKNHDTRFNEWKKRLWGLGFSQQFWDKYKLLKGDMIYEDV